MKRFLGKILTFILAFILLLAILEYTYAALENDYSYKADHLSKSENTYETIILGSSHSYYGINPQLFDNSNYLKYARLANLFKFVGSILENGGSI